MKKNTFVSVMIVVVILSGIYMVVNGNVKLTKMLDKTNTGNLIEGTGIMLNETNSGTILEETNTGITLTGTTLTGSINEVN